MFYSVGFESFYIFFIFLIKLFFVYKCYRLHTRFIAKTTLIMKTIFVLFFITIANPILGQVGINTVTPQADLDINGNLIVRTVPVDNTSTSILVLGANREVRQNTTLLSGVPKSFVSATGATGISLLNISLLNNWFKIQFPTKDFDENTDYSTATSEFTAPVAGIYNIYVQFATTSVVSASEVGVGIFKKASGASTFSLIAEETFLSVNVSVPPLLNLDVSPPTRKTQRLVKLAKGDVIIFGAKVPLVSVTLIGGSKSFFSINQVK